MEKYNYLEAMKSDILDYLVANDIEKVNDENRADIEEQLYDDLWVEDSVTGNGSGSYTFNSWQAAEMVCHNEDLLAEALEEFGCDLQCYKRAIESPEYADVTIRCYLLSQAIVMALTEWGE